MNNILIKRTIPTLSLLLGLWLSVAAQSPNILLVIADDLGVDNINGYHNSNLLPTTPNLDNLRATGLTFDNAFSTPKCTPSRATIMSGKHGVKTGVLGTPGHLSTEHTSIFNAIEAQTNGEYADAVIGKWHISQPADPLHPEAHGVDYYTGLLTAQVEDYFAWQRVVDGQIITETTYATTAITDAAIDWVNEQDQPWFLWLAHVAPHSPFHTPPDSLYTIDNTDNNRRKYIAMVEAIDHELGRLLNSLDPAERDNTIIIFIGDNGSPNTVLQDYPSGQGKATLYQGGIRVPMIVSGSGVTRSGEREAAMVHITDIYATLLEVVGADLPGGIYNSLSFKHLLANAQSTDSTRDYNYSELTEAGANGFAIRGERYKLIESLDDGSQEFFDLLTDSLETTNLLMGGLTADQLAIKADLEQEAAQIRAAWSCRDHIQNGDEQDIDCGGTYCAPCEITNTTEHIPDPKNLRLYPNPAQQYTTLELTGLEGETINWQLINLTGQAVRAGRMTGLAAEQQIRIDTHDLTPGIYSIWVVASGLQYAEELIVLPH